MLAGTGFRADMVAMFSCEVGSDILNGKIGPTTCEYHRNYTATTSQHIKSAAPA